MSLQSTDTFKFPLWALLVIYEKANEACYVDYMTGFSALVSWLSPIDITDFPPDFKCIDCLRTYEINRMAMLLNVPEESIMYSLIYEVLPKLRG